MNRPGANGNGAGNGECGCCGGNGESFSSLRNKTVNVSRIVNASVGHSPGIGYTSSCLIPDKNTLSKHTYIAIDNNDDDLSV